MISRMVREGRWPQGRLEQISYRLDTGPWGGSPTGPSVLLLLPLEDGALLDVSATALAGAPVVVGNYIDTPQVFGLTPGLVYRLEIYWTPAGTSNVLGCYGEIHAEQ